MIYALPNLNTTTTISTIFQAGDEPEKKLFPFQHLTGEAATRASQIFAIEAARHEIEEIATLEDNWDGYGASRVREQTKTNALAAVLQMLLYAPLPDIAPNPNGTISMEWESDSGTGHLEIGQSRYSFYIDRHGANAIFCDGPAEQIAPQLGLLISSTLFPTRAGTAALSTVGGDVQSTN
jgi:hypothetical protein